MSYLCIAKKDCDGLCHQRTKHRRGIEPRLSLPRKRRSGLSTSSFKLIPLDTVQLTPPQTVYYTLLFRASGRGSKVLTDKFGDSLERMTAVTDRHSAYFALHFMNHQVCLAHLLRELQYLSELNTEQNWSEQIAGIFREAIHERNIHPTSVINKSSWMKRLDDMLKQNISDLGEKFDTFKRGLIKCRDYIFNFLEDPSIPSDNNESERGIRKLKIKLKNSCTFRSDFGADAFLELHSIVETAKKNNQTPFNAIQALFEA